jgi:Xaa-Pro aminopeptidase
MSKKGKMNPVVNESSRMGCYDSVVGDRGCVVDHYIIDITRCFIIILI